LTGKEKQQQQLNVDNELLSVISKVDLMKDYLASYFTIKPGQPPHAIKF